MTNKLRKSWGLKPYIPKKRKCLSCLKMFNSWGIENRICDPCKSEHSDILDVDYTLGELYDFLPLNLPPGLDNDSDDDYSIIGED